MVDLSERSPHPSPLFWAKKEEITEERKAGRTSEKEIQLPHTHPNPLSSRSGSATVPASLDSCAKPFLADHQGSGSLNASNPGQLMSRGFPVQ